MECTQRCSTAPGHRLPNVLASTAWALHMLLQTPPVVRVCGDTARVAPSATTLPRALHVHGARGWHLGRHSLSGTGPHGSVWGPLGVRAWGRPRHLPLHSPPPPPPLHRGCPHSISKYGPCVPVHQLALLCAPVVHALLLPGGHLEELAVALAALLSYVRAPRVRKRGGLGAHRDGPVVYKHTHCDTHTHTQPMPTGRSSGACSHTWEVKYSSTYTTIR